MVHGTTLLFYNAQRGAEEHEGCARHKLGFLIMRKIAIIVSLAMLLFSSCNQHNEDNQQGLKKQREEDSIWREKMRIRDSICHVHEDSIKQAKNEKRIKLLQKKIKITKAWLSRPNSACGVDANVYYKNLSDKTIKYFVWSGYPLNAVGDRVGCEIRGFDDYRGKDTGPIKPGHSGGGCWDCAWYNCTAKKLIITGVEITYMDGSTLNINTGALTF